MSVFFSRSPQLNEIDNGSDIFQFTFLRVAMYHIKFIGLKRELYWVFLGEVLNKLQVSTHAQSIFPIPNLTNAIFL